MKLSIGDRVVLISTSSDYKGTLGTVKVLDWKGTRLVGLEMDANTRSVETRTHENIKNGHLWVTDSLNVEHVIMTNKDRMKHDLLKQMEV